jgi:tRNA 2-thiouridine synthesizing protein A
VSVSQPANQQHGQQGQQHGTPAGPVPEPTRTIDCRGQRCPMPIIILARQVPLVPVGAVVRVLSDDPAADYDIPAWCRLRDQEFLAALPAGEGSPGASGPTISYDVRRTT